MAQTLTEIRRLLDEHGLRPKHKWGQNFLHDQNHMDRIVAAAELAEGDLVLEVGAGTGSLTERLAEAGARVVAVEIDQDLGPILQQRLAPFGRQVAIHIGDVLSGKRALSPAVLALLHEQGRSDEADSNEPTPPFKLIANLPYNVASPLLSTLAMDHPQMALGVVMVQREVADRLTAEPGSKQYGPLGILVQAMCEAERVATLPASCFWPRPKVSSAVVRLRRRETPATDHPHRLADLVHQLFTKRRKQLGAILGRDRTWPDGICPNDRPEQLTVAQLVELAETESP